jgi:hypothetical protein
MLPFSAALSARRSSVVLGIFKNELRIRLRLAACFREGTVH